MHPVLFHLNLPGGGLQPIAVTTYGVALAMAALIAYRLASQAFPTRANFARLASIGVVAGGVGARLGYVFANSGEFDSWRDVLAVRGGGLHGASGLLVGLGLVVWLARRRIVVWDQVALALASGAAVIRGGCYAFGCCYGRLAHHLPPVVGRLGEFPRWSVDTMRPLVGSPAWVAHVRRYHLPVTAKHSFPIHPTQLYGVALALACVALVLFARRRLWLSPRHRGILALAAFSIGSVAIGVVRDDPERGLVAEIPLVVVVGFAVAATTGWIMLLLRRLRRSPRSVLAGLFLVAAAIVWTINARFGRAVTEVSISQVWWIAIQLPMAWWWLSTRSGAPDTENRIDAAAEV